MISASGISKNFGKTYAVRGVSFDVDKGKIFGIVGPDGAGKSTLLRMAAAIMKPDSGSILIEGKNIFDNTYAAKEKIAYMPQRFGLYEDLTVEENIFFFGRIFSLSKKEIRKRLPRLYDFSRLEPFRNRLAGKLSGGMKQKLGLACCLVHTPELLLLDEPTNGVDPVSRRDFWNIIYDLVSEGVAIVVSTSYLDEASRCNHVALMHEGKFIKTGTPLEIIRNISRRMIEIETTDYKNTVTILKKTGFHDIIRAGSSIRIFTDDVKKTSEKIRMVLKKNHIEFTGIRESIPTLEDCFIEIIGSEKK